MSNFLADFEKVNPVEPAKQEQPTNPASLTLQDMKDYFEAMKTQMISELKAEIAKTSATPEEVKTTPENIVEAEKEE